MKLNKKSFMALLLFLSFLPVIQVRAEESKDKNHTMFSANGYGILQTDPWTIYDPATGKLTASDETTTATRGRSVMDDLRSRGVEIWRITIPWAEYETKDGVFKKELIDSYKEQIDALTARGYKIVLHFNLSDPAPPWIAKSTDPAVRPAIFYKNQYGENFVQTEKEMKENVSVNPVNMVFNPFIRDKVERAEAKLFEHLGEHAHKIWAVTMTLTNDTFFPHAVDWHGKECTYWGFDEYAKRQEPLKDGRWPSLTNRPNPAPGWMPGTHDPDDPDNHEQAGRFLAWYLDSLKEAIHWRLKSIRRHYNGEIMLYSFVFARQFDLEPFIEADLDCEAAPTLGEFAPNMGFADSRYLESIQAKFSDSEIIVHDSGLENIALEGPEVEKAFQKTKDYYSRLGTEEATVAGDVFPYKSVLTDEVLFPKASDLMKYAEGLIRKYKFYEFMWYGTFGLYDPDTDAYDIKPQDYGKMIRRINGDPPAISEVKARRISPSQVEVSWKTSDPATSRVIYCEDRWMRVNAKAVYDSNLTKEHKVILSVKPDTEYFFEVGSDNTRNYALSEVMTLNP